MASRTIEVCNERHKSIDREVEDIKAEQRHIKKNIKDINRAFDHLMEKEKSECDKKFFNIEETMKNNQKSNKNEREKIWNNLVPQKIFFYIIGGIVTFSIMLFSILQYNIEQSNNSIEENYKNILAELQK